MNAFDDVLDTLERHPGAPLHELARRSGWSTPTVRRWVLALVDSGSAVRASDGYRLVRRPTAAPDRRLRFKRHPKVLDVDAALVALLATERHTVDSASVLTGHPAYMVRDRLTRLALLGVVAGGPVWYYRHPALVHVDPRDALSVARCVGSSPRTAGWIAERSRIPLATTRRILHALADAGAVVLDGTSPQTWRRA